MSDSTKNINALIDHLFRHEAGKLVSVLTRIFGSENIDLAEDVVQDSMVEAIREWSYKGVPENPSGWLFKVAKNKALNIVNREKYKRQYSSDVVQYLQSEWTLDPGLDYIFSEEEIKDDQLRMMFTCCHPSITQDSQIALILKTLCGFSIPEIARAFLTTDDTINKRLVRARQKIREAKIPFEVPKGQDLARQLETVLGTIYLLFNEGYSASTGNDLIRYELCEEAIRLNEIMADNESVQSKSDVFALLSLMYLNAARFKSRLDGNGNIIQMSDQDRSLWDQILIQKGFICLGKLTASNRISFYHILAMISAYHCSASDFESTDWKGILSLYDNLIQMDDSPLVLLNRAVVVSKVEGAENAVLELEKIKNIPVIQSYHLFYSTLAEFHIQLKNYSQAAIYLKKAINLSPIGVEKELLNKKLELCNQHLK
ncbi:MAG TPA: sigma-70 family RNA polymerase sigma factor [Cytophagaceae bacterium]|jgi:RNA polymerase sigma factor (sigma-70 family)|nr:sigma-70 family RNA polymerase sigma factor [Cytophagaceae bacterium]